MSNSLFDSLDDETRTPEPGQVRIINMGEPTQNEPLELSTPDPEISHELLDDTPAYQPETSSLKGGLTFGTSIHPYDATGQRRNEAAASGGKFELFGTDLFGSAITQDTKGVLRERFEFPPFSVLNAREGQWQERKRAWIATGIQSELGRGIENLNMAHPETTSTIDFYAQKRELERQLGKVLTKDEAADLMREAGTLKDSRQVNADRQEVRGLTWGNAPEITEPGLNYYRNKNKAEAFGSGKPGDLAAGFKRDASPGGSARPAMDYSNKERGDGAGRPLPERGGINGPWSNHPRYYEQKCAAEATLGRELTPEEFERDYFRPPESEIASGTSIFDPVLTELMYRWFCPPGGLILDPFAGGSVRGIVAGLLGYRYHGIDLRPEQIIANEEQRERIAPGTDITWVVGDSNVKLKDAPDADFVFSCPPYGDLERYSDDPSDLSTMTWEQFVGLYRAIIRKAVERLKPNRFAAFVVGEYRDPKTGLYRGFVPLTCASFMAAGAPLYNEAVLLTAVGSLPIRVTKQFGASRKLGKTHQNVIICVKGDPRLAVAAIETSPSAGKATARPDPPTSSEGNPGPPADPPIGSSGTLAQFLGSVPVSPVIDWTPAEPPALDGISDLELDTETNGLKWWAGNRPIGISIRRPDGFTQYLPWGHLGGGNLDEATVRRWAERELRGKRLTGANIRFDVHMLREWGVDLEAQGCTVSDVQHYAALLDDTRRHFSLDVLAKDYLGKEKIGKDLDATRMADYHAGQVAPRAEGDVRLTGELRQAMWPLLDADDLQRVRQLEDDVIFPVCEMEKNAAPLDVDLLKQWCVEAERATQQCLEDVAKEVGFWVNPDSNQDWVRLFDRLGIPVTSFTEPSTRYPQGQASFTDAVLKGIDNRSVQQVRRAGKLASLRSKFLDAYRDVVGPDGLLRFYLHQLRNDEYGTVRGRFSASDKNIQQVMNKETHEASFGSDEFFVRRLFIPGSGLYLSADAQQVEYRIFASRTGSPKILAAYAENPEMSYHKYVWEMVKPFKPDIPYGKTKQLNFLKIYGGGKEKTAAFLELPRTESDAFVGIYDRQFPEVAILMRKATRLAETRGYVRTVCGRRARFADKKFAHKALNAVIQGSAADIMKQKLVELHADRKSTGFTMRMTVHDEVCGDVPDVDSADKVKAILNRQSFPELKVPILWSVNTGANWAACK